MSVILFEDGQPAILNYSERPCLLLAAWESGKVAYITTEGVLRVTEDEVRLPVRYDEISGEWTDQLQKPLDTAESDTDDDEQ